MFIQIRARPSAGTTWHLLMGRILGFDLACTFVLLDDQLRRSAIGPSHVGSKLTKERQVITCSAHSPQRAPACEVRQQPAASLDHEIEDVSFTAASCECGDKHVAKTVQSARIKPSSPPEQNANKHILCFTRLHKLFAISPAIIRPLPCALTAAFAEA